MNELVIEPEILEGLYYGNGCSLRQIANIFDCDFWAIWNRMKEYSIPRRGVGGKKDFDIESELLESLYYGNNYSIPNIANIFGCDSGTILRRMIEYDIPRRSIADAKRDIIVEPELLESLYWGNGYPRHTIASIFGCGQTTILRNMMKYGITRRDGSELTDFTFNNRQKEIFEGCMLGDGNLAWITNNCRFRNGDIHKDYLDWLQKLLGVEGISKITPGHHFIGAKSYLAYHLATRVIPSIKDEFKRWYPNGEGTRNNIHYKIIPKDIELTLTKMLFWYIGDGYYYKKKKNARFCNFLVFDDWELLSKKMSKVLDVDNGISICKHGKDNAGVQRYNLCLSRAVTKKFFNMVDNLGFDIPDCYKYKFGR